MVITPGFPVTLRWVAGLDRSYMALRYRTRMFERKVWEARI